MSIGNGDIVLGRWLYDEKEEPELTKEDAWRSDAQQREPGVQGAPVVVSRGLVKSGHLHLRGKSGSGKTSRILTPYVSQLLQPYQLDHFNFTDGVRQRVTERDAVIIVDLGGDPVMFNTIKAQVDADPERNFRFLSLDSQRSEKFDPFQSIPEGGYRIIRLCNLFLEAFSLDHGLAYGGSWYSQRNLLLLLSICERLVAQRQSGKEITLREVDRYLQDPDTASIKDAEQIRGIFKFLLEYDCLQPSPSDKNAINIKDCIRNRDVVYAFVPSIAEATTARQIAGLVMYTAVNAAMTLYEEELEHDRPHPHVHLVCDEFQQIAGASFEALLTGARKYSLSMVLANQTTESLISRDKDLSSTVRDNCSIRIYQTVTGKRDIEELLTFSRESTRTLKSKKNKESIRVKGRSALSSGSESESITTQLSRSEVLSISSTEGASLVIIDDGLGHREAIPMQSDYLISKEQYLEYKSTPLPKTGKVSPISMKYAGALSSMPAWRSAHLETSKPQSQQDRLNRFAETIERIRRDETGGEPHPHEPREG